MFSRWWPTGAYLWIKAILLAAVAIQLARLIWILATPVGPLGDWRPAPARLPSPQAQAAVIAAVNPFFRNANASTPEPPSLDLELFGTREDRRGGGGAAVIGPADGEQKSYLVGEEIVPGLKLAAVHFDHVVLDRGQERQQKLYIDQSQEVPQIVRDAASGASAIGPTAPTLQQALRLTPRVQNGRVNGVSVGPGSDVRAFASAGFLPGDVIVAVNGARITSQTDVVQLQSSISPGARLSFTVERGARTVPVALNLVEN